MMVWPGATVLPAGTGGARQGRRLAGRFWSMAVQAALGSDIALATVRFPDGTIGMQLDSFARRPLWEAGLDYAHGTGHGVGSFLSVHEGPQRISKLPNTVALKPGMMMGGQGSNSLQKIAMDYIDSHGKDKEGRTLGRYYIHGLSHHIGLNVHDPGGPSRPPLVALRSPP